MHVTPPGGAVSSTFRLLILELMGYPPPPSPLVESWSYMLFRLQNIDSPGLIWKIFRNKDLRDPFPFGSAQGQDFGSGLTPSTTLRVTPAERLNLAAGEILL